jgi:diguanylate cyclase (GGDEF)-like protein
MEEVVKKEKFFALLDNQQIQAVFQPIVSLRDGSLYGYEALSRGTLKDFAQDPDTLFAYAEKYDKLWDLELLCRTKAIEAAHELNMHANLFLNVNPSIIHDNKFKEGFTKEYIRSFAIQPEKIIFEITEKKAVNNIPDFIKTINHYKQQNYRIAIDDAGAGYSGLNMISDVRPHFIKLDMNLIRDVDNDATKQLLIKSMAEFAALSNTYLIAEGIETEAELLKLIDIGVNYGQGYFIQRPAPQIKPIENDVVQTIHEANRKKNHLWGNGIAGVYVGNISKPSKTISANSIVSDVFYMMKEENALPGVCITHEDEVVGVVTRNELFKHVSGQYGYPLYFKKPISNMMSTDYLCVDYQTSIVTVAKKAMQREVDKIYDFITITKENKYYGIVTVKDLLEKSIEIEVGYAKHLNPLSELPGNLLIEKQLEMCIHADADYKIIYFDVDNFKAYNDTYGFENGDKFLKRLTQILKNHIPCEEFIGHIGGDDFIAIVPAAHNVDELCAKIIEEFDESILFFYKQGDIKRGYIVTKDREGMEKNFPLMSISVVATSNDKYKSLDELSDSVTTLKKICKQKEGSNYVFI